jgi:hypothetical protein
MAEGWGRSLKNELLLVGNSKKVKFSVDLFSVILF